MASPMLFEPTIVDGILVFVFSDTRSLSLAGGSMVTTSFNQKLLSRVGLYDDGEIADVDQECVVDPEDGELRVTCTIDLDGLDALEDLPELKPAEEPAFPAAD